MNNKDRKLVFSRKEDDIFEIWDWESGIPVDFKEFLGLTLVDIEERAIGTLLHFQAPERT